MCLFPEVTATIARTVLWWNGLYRRWSAVRAFRCSASCRDAFLAADRAVQGFDQRLHLDELAARPLGRIPVEGRGQHLRVSVPLLDHAFTGRLQCFESSAH